MPRIRITKPTCTLLTEEVLRGCDDFLNRRQIEQLTGCSANQASAALFHLRKRRVVDVIVEADGVGWWYALPPEQDTRSRTVSERKDGEKRNRKTSKRGKSTTKPMKGGAL